MASARDMRRRIKSIRNTAQITKAMQMVAASRMRRAQQVALAGRPYADLMNRVHESAVKRIEQGEHPLLVVRPVKKEMLLVISTDKGLCGPLNTNLLREVSKTDATKTAYVTAGRKGRQFVQRSRRELVADFEMKEHIAFLESKKVSKFLIDQFLAGAADRVTVAYTNFVNTVVQNPILQPILPISELGKKLEAGIDDHHHGAAASPREMTAASPREMTAKEEKKQEQEESIEYLFEPSADKVLGALLPHYIHFQVYHMFLEARASEHSARMVAMKNATDNAQQLIKDLTLEYNKMRQASITTELLDIVTAQSAVG